MDGGRSFQPFSCWSELQQEKPVVRDSHRGGGERFVQLDGVREGVV